jgi:hypothetical protein
MKLNSQALIGITPRKLWEKLGFERSFKKDSLLKELRAIQQLNT